MGDEICCANATCWTAALKPVTEKLRTMLGKDAIIYTNECANHEITEVPPEFDLISVDVCKCLHHTAMALFVYKMAPSIFAVSAMADEKCTTALFCCVQMPAIHRAPKEWTR